MKEFILSASIPGTSHAVLKPYTVKTLLAIIKYNSKW